MQATATGVTAGKQPSEKQKVVSSSSSESRLFCGLLRPVLNAFVGNSEADHLQSQMQDKQMQPYKKVVLYPLRIYNQRVAFVENTKLKESFKESFLVSLPVSKTAGRLAVSPACKEGKLQR